MTGSVWQKGTIIDGRLPFINPATGDRFGEVTVSTRPEVESAVADVRAASAQWRARPIRERYHVLRDLSKLIFDELDAITAVITRDTGKPRQDALIEVFTCLNYLNVVLKKAPRWLRDERVGTGLQFFKRAYVTRRPYGAVAVISPWNYPFVLTMNPLLGALVAGNGVVAKPSEVTPAVGVMMSDLLARVPALRPLVRFVHGDGAVGAALVEAPPDLIFVTGSVRTGKLISQTAAATLTPVICELGGKDPMLVLEDADIAAAARWGAWGAFSNSGQTCMSPERIYVVEPVYDAFVAAIRAQAERLQVGYTLEEASDYDYGCMTFPRQLEIVNAHLDDARAKGAQILVGGSHEALFCEPTIVTGAHEDMLLLQEETFGAVMPVVKVRDEAEAIARANDSVYGLSASVFSEDVQRARRVAEALEVGSVNINDTISHYGLPELPFGGTKASGHGRSNGREGLQAFTYPVGIVWGKPRPWDIATQLRQPGNYYRAKAAMAALIGPTWRQRLRGLYDLVRDR